MSQTVDNIVTPQAFIKGTERRRGLVTFVTIWFGQTVSIIGSALTGFALAVWVYQRTGSATEFSFIVLSTVSPGILISPLLGVVVDRYDRRRIMILSNLVSGACTLLMAALYIRGSLQVWSICSVMVVMSLSGSLLNPSYTASISSIVPKEFLGRASGMIQFGGASADMLAPLVAAFLIITIHVSGILVVDFATYLFAVLTLLVVRFPNVPRSRSSAVSLEVKRPLFAEVSLGLRYLIARPGLLALIGFFTLTNFLLGMENVLLPPLVISFAGAAAFGTVAALGGTGMLLGSLAMSIWGGPKHRVRGVYLYGLMLGTALVLEGLRPNPWLIAAGAFIAAFGTPIANGCAIPILQIKTEPELQGRVFTTMRFIAGLALPISYLAAGRLADAVFEPLMAPHGSLSTSAGRILGVGHGRGTALLLLVLGILAILLTLRSLSYRPLLRVESDIPDAIIPEKIAS